MNYEIVKKKRCLKIELPKGQSAFLWGARKTGKTTFLKDQFPDSLTYDLLKTDLYFEFTKSPWKLRERLLACRDEVLQKPVIVDEVQKVPQLLDEIHWLIENKNISFILCGSSARKLKRGQANLLGGRAWRYEMFPLVSKEVGSLDILTVLNRGMIPLHFFSKNHKKFLKGYLQDYLKEEIFDEGLTRNVPAFSRFFEAMGYCHGELINYSNIARDCGVNSKTVKEYFQILEDTLLGYLIQPFRKPQHRQVIQKAPKFYLFDTGVAGMITKRNIPKERGIEFGKALEHYIFMEIVAYRSYQDCDFDINFWRTKTGLEVDFVLGGGQVALEVKGTSQVKNEDIRALRAFDEEFSPQKALLISNEKAQRVVGNIKILPWQDFLNKLWANEIMS